MPFSCLFKVFIIFVFITNVNYFALLQPRLITISKAFLAFFAPCSSDSCCILQTWIKHQMSACFGPPH